MATPTRRPTGPPPPRTVMLAMRVWDLPTRLFHWAIVALVLASYLSAQREWAQLHAVAGYTMLALLLFRLAWAIVGSETARFGRLLRSPLTGLRHLRQFDRREPQREIGPSAAGGWLALAMLVTLAVQAGTGLFAGDPIDGGGPFVGRVAETTQKTLNKLHHLNFNLILLLIGLHLLAILAYAGLKRHDLARPMVTGRQRLPANTRQPRLSNPLLALAILLAAAGLVWAMVRFV